MKLSNKEKLNEINEYFSNRHIDDYEESEKKDVPGYEGLYMVTKDGGVWGCKRKKFLKITLRHDGRLRVCLSKNSERKIYMTYRLVALAFIPNPNPEKLTFVGHEDDDIFNNHISNLYWTDAPENNIHNDRHLCGAKAVRRIEDGKIFESASAAARETGTSASNIRRVCTGKGQTAGKYHWEFIDETHPMNFGKKRPVYDIDDDIIYESIRAAARALGVDESRVRRCCNGEQKRSGGHRLMYADEMED